MTKAIEEQISDLKQAIAAQERLRPTLGDAIVETTQAALHKQLAKLEAQVTPPEQERKQITVLFADVPGFTAMAETLDAEDVAAVMNALWQRLDATITAHGGLIDKHIGDAVMALWGAELAREDDPERAIRAALAMQAALAAFREDHAARTVVRGVVLAMRIGINTGPVLLGEVGTTGEFTALGDTVNLASRLEHAAPVGGILVSHDTYRHVRGVFDVLAQDPLSVKGKAEPVQTYVVQRAKPRAFRVGTRGVEGVETRMIGREAELERLQDAFVEAVRGAFRMVTVTGEAGVGKSRLLHEFDVWVTDQPEYYWLFKGRASQEVQALPYALLRDMFSFRFQIQDSDPLAVVRDKVEQGVRTALGEAAGTQMLPQMRSQSQMRAHFIGQLIGFDFSGSPHIQGILEDAKQIRDRALVYIGDYFKAMAAQGPILMLLEDIHWADESSLDTLNHLTQVLADHPILIVCATRPGLFERRPHWGGGGALHTCIDLHPLSRRDCRALVDEVLQKADLVPDALREVVVSNAEGNPFYVEELIKMLIEDGVIIRDAERWQVKPTRLLDVRIPPTLTAVLQARLDRLPPEEKTTLQQASVVGRIFWDAAVAFLDDPETLVLVETTATLGTLRSKEMVFPRETSTFAGTHEYLFKHALLRDATYESVLKRVRRAYHASAAEWLITYGGERVGEVAGLIADHLEQAGQAEQAADYLRQAGEKAFAASAYREAVRFAERALRLLPAGSSVRPALLIQASWALINLGELAEARRCLAEGLALARKLGDEGEGVAALALGRLGTIARQQGDWIEARERLAESLVLARKIGDQVPVAHALYELGWVNFRQGALPEARTHFAEGLALCRALGDRMGQARVLNGLGTVAMELGEYKESNTLYLESLAWAREVGDRACEAATLCNLGETARLQGEYAEARRYYEKGLEIDWEIGRQLGAAIKLGNLGHVAAAVGDYVTAVDYYHKALQMNMDIGANTFTLADLAGLACVLAHTGQPERALELLGLAMHHPALLDDIKLQFVVPLLADLRVRLPEDVVEAGLARGRELDLEKTVAEILKEGSPQ